VGGLTFQLVAAGAPTHTAESAAVSTP